MGTASKHQSDGTRRAQENADARRATLAPGGSGPAILPHARAPPPAPPAHASTTFPRRRADGVWGRPAEDAITGSHRVRGRISGDTDRTGPICRTRKLPRPRQTGPRRSRPVPVRGARTPSATRGGAGTSRRRDKRALEQVIASQSRHPARKRQRANHPPPRDADWAPDFLTAAAKPAKSPPGHLTQPPTSTTAPPATTGSLPPPRPTARARSGSRLLRIGHQSTAEKPGSVELSPGGFSRSVAGMRDPQRSARSRRRRALTAQHCRRRYLRASKASLPTNEELAPESRGHRGVVDGGRTLAQRVDPADAGTARSGVVGVHLASFNRQGSELHSVVR